MGSPRRAGRQLHGTSRLGGRSTDVGLPLAWLSHHSSPPSLTTRSSTRVLSRIVLRDKFPCDMIVVRLYWNFALQGSQLLAPDHRRTTDEVSMHPDCDEPAGGTAAAVARLQSRLQELAPRDRRKDAVLGGEEPGRDLRRWGVVGSALPLFRMQRRMETASCVTKPPCFLLFYFF